MQIDSTSPRDLDAVLAFFDALNRHDVEGLLATVHPEIVYTFHHAGFAPARGIEEMRAAWTMMLATFPDVREDILEVRARDGLVVVHWVLSGTLAGPLPLGSKIAIPSGRMPKVSIKGVDVFTLKDGLIATKDSYADVGAWFEAYAPITVAAAAA